jgi:acetate kinase
VRITPDILRILRDLVPLAPDHLPGALSTLDAVARAFPAAPQVACFDTAFHRTMPRLAQVLPLPRRFLDAGWQRFGFHGLSFEFVVAELRRLGDSRIDVGRVVVAHLGNGASLAAIRDGAGVDTTMGMTPLGGLVMGTRTGDLDPGILLRLLRDECLSPDDLHRLIHRECGLLGVSGRTSDMRELLHLESTDARAAEAIGLFVRQAAKHVAAMAVALGGIDLLVFTGGIGENAPTIRARIADALDFLGICLDAARNSFGDAVISTDASPTTVRVVRTNEELMIARHTLDVVRGGVS